jgi:hypothetical protein
MFNCAELEFTMLRNTKFSFDHQKLSNELSKKAKKENNRQVRATALALLNIESMDYVSTPCSAVEVARPSRLGLFSHSHEAPRAKFPSVGAFIKQEQVERPEKKSISAKRPKLGISLPPQGAIEDSGLHAPRADEREGKRPAFG